jgi:hypothetical protein
VKSRIRTKVQNRIRTTVQSRTRYVSIGAGPCPLESSGRRLNCRLPLGLPAVAVAACEWCWCHTWHTWQSFFIVFFSYSFFIQPHHNLTRTWTPVCRCDVNYPHLQLGPWAYHICRAMELQLIWWAWDPEATFAWVPQDYSVLGKAQR